MEPLTTWKRWALKTSCIGTVMVTWTFVREHHMIPPKLLKHIYLQLQKHSTQNSCYRIESTVCGHHVYKVSWSPYIGEELPVQHELPVYDDFTVAVLKNSSTVGHVPREISRVYWYFLHKSGSEMTCSHKLTKDSLYSMHLQSNWARVVNIFQKTLTGGRYNESHYPMQELWR